MIFAQQNGRQIPKEDKIFGISSRAKARIAEKGKDNVINGTIGALIDDDGQISSAMTNFTSGWSLPSR